MCPGAPGEKKGSRICVNCISMCPGEKKEGEARRRTAERRCVLCVCFVCVVVIMCRSIVCGVGIRY